MTYRPLPIDPPPGVITNGTLNQLQGRWIDSDGIRFEGGSVRPMLGWQLVAGDETSLSAYAPLRGLYAWRWTDNSRYVAMGSADALLVKAGSYSHDGIVEITPSNFNAGLTGGTTAYGYGRGPYGRGAYGSDYTEGIGDPANPVQQATTWTFAVRRGELYALSTTDRRILRWTPPDTGSAAVHLPNSPDRGVDAFCITQQQQIFAIGESNDRTIAQWSDGANPELWIPDLTNNAGNLILPLEGQVVQCFPYGGDVLVWTSSHFLRLIYLGASSGFAVSGQGQNTPCVGPNAIARHKDILMWMGKSEFYAYDGAAVRDVPCDVWDWVFGRFNELQGYKVTTAVLPESNTIRWFFVARPDSEINRYVEYNWISGLWIKGSVIKRTAWMNSGIYDFPLAADVDNKLYQHELKNYTASDSSVTVALPPQQNGDIETIMERIEHDVIGDGQFSTPGVELFVEGANNPNMAPVPLLDRPLNYNGITPFRTAAKWLTLRFRISSFSDWKLGRSNVYVKPGGRRGRLQNQGAIGDPFAPQPNYIPPEFLSNPSVTDVLAYSARIFWAADSQHTWAIDIGDRRYTGDTQNEAVITELDPNTTYENLELFIYDIVGNDNSAPVPSFTTEPDTPFVASFDWVALSKTAARADFVAEGFAATAQYEFLYVDTGETWIGSLSAPGAQSVTLDDPPLPTGPFIIDAEKIILTITNDEGGISTEYRTPQLTLPGDIQISNVTATYARPADRKLGFANITWAWDVAPNSSSRMRWREITGDGQWSGWILRGSETGSHDVTIDDIPCADSVYEIELACPSNDLLPVTAIERARFDTPDYSEEYLNFIVETPFTYAPGTGDKTTLTINWTLEPNDTGDACRIRYRRPGEVWSAWSTAGGAGPNFSWTSGDLEPGDVYQFQLAAPEFIDDFDGNYVQIGSWTSPAVTIPDLT